MKRNLFSVIRIDLRLVDKTVKKEEYDEEYRVDSLSETQPHLQAKIYQVIKATFSLTEQQQSS